MTNSMQQIPYREANDPSDSQEISLRHILLILTVHYSVLQGATTGPYEVNLWLCLTKHHAMKAYTREGSEWSAPRADHYTTVK